MSQGVRDLFIVIFLLVGLGIAWYYTGGPDRALSRSGPFLSLPSSRTYGPAYPVPGVSLGSSTRRENEEITGRGGSSFFSSFTNYLGTFKESRSPYAEYVRLEKGRADADIKDEYVVIKTLAGAPERTVITGWRIESTATSLGTIIGQAADLPFIGQSTAENPIALGPKSTVYLATGRSPVGISFRTNLCAGYFEQFQDFSPRLKLECPRPDDEALRVIGVGAYTDECRDIVGDINRCELTLNAIAPKAGIQCQNFIQEKLTYNGCINDHKNDPGFYKDEWYLYLKRDQELWKNRYERIRLLDENGKTVGVISY